MKLPENDFGQLFRLALPIALQNFLTSTLNLVAGLLVGQLGETAIAAVGLGNQLFFIINFLLFGISTGCAIFTAQLWGIGNVQSIRRVQGLSLALAFVGAGIFFTIAMAFPETILSFYTADPAVIALGASFLRISAPGFLMIAVVSSFSAVLRSCGEVRVPLLASMLALGLDVVLSFVLIFGHLGLPRMGVNGAALAATLSRCVECTLLISIIYFRGRKLPGSGLWAAASPLKDMFQFDRAFTTTVVRRALPVAANELLWAAGISTCNAIYARIGTEAVAAVNIASTIENLAFVLFVGLSDATGILVGNAIGARREDSAYRIARRSLLLAITGALVVGLVVKVGAPLILNLYRVSPAVMVYTRNVLTAVALFLWLRVSNLTLIVGIFRNGGDTHFSFLLDVSSIWLIGVPLAAFGAFVLSLPVYWVYVMVLGEELAKFVVGLFRFSSRRWVHNLADSIQA